ncbi:MAG TPA: right-handed parallel beta-helix repeat-containing protein [Planctomycetaceae bacterium]
MSLSSTAFFEVRPGAGSATNGGGFVPGSSGTDWSQQNAAQYALTNGVATTGNATINTASASADMVGNIVYVAGGTGAITGAWYQILSQVTGTSITLDRSTGLVTGTGVTLNIGGALDLCATAEPLLTAGMTLWIKATGTQTLTNPINLTAGGDATSGPITWQGYHTTRGDHDGTRPLITTATNSKDLIRSTAGAPINYRVWDNLNFSSTAGTPGNGITGGSGGGGINFSTISHCKISGCNAGIDGDNSAYFAFGNLNIVNVEVTGCADAIVNTSTLKVSGCCIHGNSGYGIKLPSLASTVLECIVRDTVIYANANGIYSLAAVAIANNQGALLDIDHCAIVGNTNDGIQNAAANGRLSVLSLQNSILYGNGGFGVNITNAAAMIVVNRNNAYGSNASGNRNNLAAGAGDVTLSADPFTAKSSNDFSLNSTAGGGAACKGAGFPGSIPGLVTAGSADIGALQHADPASAATILICSPRKVR